MGIEEKAKAYDAALERAKGILCDGNCSDIEAIFPELRESDDERIRKWIIEELEITRDAMSGKNPYSDDPDIVARLKRLDEAIDYLEKQKDFAANEYWRGFGAGRDEVIANPDAFNLLEKQQEIPMPDSTELIEMWDKEEAMLKEKDFRGDTWRIAYNAFLDGFGKGYMVKQKPTPDWMPKFLDELRSKKNYFDWDEHRDIEGHILAIINWIAPNYFEEKEQKPNIELIQRSWYMEGYHDRDFGMEPRWIIKTGEGGPKHELNPRYGQPLVEQKPADEQFPPLEGLDAIKAEYYDRGFKNGFDEGVESVKPAEWSEEDEEMWMDIKSHMIHGSFIPFDKIEWIENRLNSLQQGQPTVDFERDAVQFCFDKGLNITPYQAKTIARHFYELGLNARKEENK